MSFFRCLPGADALSVFRQQRLLSHLHQHGIELQSIHAQYLHFVWSDQELSSDQVKILGALLQYGEPYTKPKANQSAIIIPRFGTVSPWASKATDIQNIYRQVAEISQVPGASGVRIPGTVAGDSGADPAPGTVYRVSPDRVVAVPGRAEGLVRCPGSVSAHPGPGCGNWV